MCKTKVWVNVDRAAALRRGINGTESPVAIEIDVTNMTLEDRADVAYRFCVSGSRPDYSIPAHTPYLRARSGDTLWSNPMTVVEPSQSGLIAALAADRRAVQEEAAKKAAEKQNNLEEGLRWLTCEPKQTKRTEAVFIDAVGRACEWSGKYCREYSFVSEYIYTQYGDEKTKAACVERENSIKMKNKIRENEAKEAALASMRAEYIQPKLDWICTYGSADLLRMVSEDMDWSVMYEDEHRAWADGISTGRLLSERPGWTVVEKGTADSIDPPKKPRARAWMILDEARKSDPSAKLGRLNGKYIAYAEFDGKTIIWPAE